STPPFVALPAVPCVVSQWSVWSGCAEPCRTAYRVRRRRVLQEPRNGGAACPALEQRGGCVRYPSAPAAECGLALVPALITTGGFGKARRKRAAADGDERTGYCVEFQLTAIAPGCLRSHRSHTRWMLYLREGHTACVECQHPALDSTRLHCHGDGSGSKNTLTFSLFRLFQGSAVALAGGREPSMPGDLEENPPAGHLLLSFRSQLLVHLTPTVPASECRGGSCGTDVWQRQEPQPEQ
ncbi:somatomedin-B and thrombospondin type-1 domain-containing protein, partial [Columba guinea]